MIDVSGVALERLEDAALMQRVLVELAAECRLEICAGPQLVPFTPVGLTGFVVLRESHIAFHTYPEEGQVALDLYSCQPVPRRQILMTLRSLLGPSRMRSRMLRRAGYPTRT